MSTLAGGVQTARGKAQRRPPVRRNVGVCVVDRRTGLVFAAQRSDSSCQTWQMPQGGVDEGEAPEQAALRELEEETCIRTARVVGEIDKYLIYEFPTTVCVCVPSLSAHRRLVVGQHLSAPRLNAAHASITVRRCARGSTGAGKSSGARRSGGSW